MRVPTWVNNTPVRWIPGLDRCGYLSSLADDLNSPIWLIPHWHVGALIEHDPLSELGGRYAALVLGSNQPVLRSPYDGHGNVSWHMVSSRELPIEHAVMAGVEANCLPHRLCTITE
jgi:hypothetical protein